MEDLTFKELTIVDDIDHNLALYDINELSSEEEIKEAIKIISELFKDYRHVHLKLNQLLDKKYDENYPKFLTTHTKVNAYLKLLQSKLRNKKSDIESSNMELEKKNVIVEIDFLSKKVDNFNEAVDVNIIRNLDDIDKYVTKMEGFINEFFTLSTKLKCICPDQFDEFSKDFETAVFEIQQDIKLAHNLKYGILQLKENLKKKENLQNDQLKHTVNAENLKTEISYRFKALSQKYKIDLDNLGDYQILEIKQDKSLDLEFNALLEKITELASLATLGGGNLNTLLEKVCKTRDRLAIKRENFLKKLQDVSVERDITAEKLKNGSDIFVEIPKFSGYDGKIDFFTFRSKFRKLIEDRVQKKYWVEHLRHKYLAGHAFTLVEKESDYEKIWEKLSKSFGNPRHLLQNKVDALENVSLTNAKGDEKIGSALAHLINVMKDLSVIAVDHDIEGQLYEGGGLEKVFYLIGDSRHRKFRSENLTATFSKKQEWQKLVVFLERDLQLREKMTLDYKAASTLGIVQQRKVPKADDKQEQNARPILIAAANANLKCHICDELGHTKIVTARGNVIIPYYVCEKFVQMSAQNRLETLRGKNLCIGCLFPGAIKSDKHKCFYTNYCCPSHPKSQRIHILLCEEHKSNEKNIKLLEKFKEKFIAKCPVNLPPFANTLTFYGGMAGFGLLTRPVVIKVGKFEGTPVVTAPAIFMLQTILVDGVRLNIFFDSGCYDMIIKKSAVDKLLALERAEKISSDECEIVGVGGVKSLCKEGFFSIALPMYNGDNAILTGLCIEQITCEFPKCKLSEINKDVRERAFTTGGESLLSRLPGLPESVGGSDTDILVGITFFARFPDIIHKFDDGFAISESPFLSPDGTRGVVSGPHTGITLSNTSNTTHPNHTAYLTAHAMQYNMLRKSGWEIPLLHEKVTPSSCDIDRPICCDHSDKEACPSENPVCEQEVECVHSYHCVCMPAKPKRVLKNVKLYDEIEAAGTEITYRCVECRACPKCKNGPKFESISITDELEHNLIEKCVLVDIEANKTVAKLPFVLDPDTHLVSNENVALKVYNSQVRLLNSKPEDKKSVLDFETKLQDMGFVDWVDNLPEGERSMIDHTVKYFIPWRATWKPDSVSTPVRMVFDASMASGKESCALNSILAKGPNSLNNLISITIRWVFNRHIFHADVQKMYNRVFLDPSHWRYQLYLMSEGLNVGDAPRWKVIKTLIYGVRPSGALAECALRRTVELCKDKYPLAYRPIMEDTYMDDCVSGTGSPGESTKVMDQIQLALWKGGFTLKGFTTSGCDPAPKLSADGKSVFIFGLKYFPKDDFYKLNISEKNFSRKVRGRKNADRVGIIPDKLTLQNCASRAAEVYDLLGRVAPIMGGIKIDISTLHKKCSGWNDPIPYELKEIWAANFDLIDEIGKLEFQRAVVPPDASNLDVELLEIADASDKLVCSAVYARFLKRDGSHSCQLIFARTKIVHDISIPRAELVASVLLASTGHVVRLSLKEHVKKSWHISDSQVALSWINCTKAALKVWVRNRVVEATRLTDSSRWFFVKSGDNIADIGTRKGAKIEDVEPGSPWSVGFPWMREREENFPLTTIEEIALSAKEKADLNKEKVLADPMDFVNEHKHANLCPDGSVCMLTGVPKEVEERYKFSNYLINPCKFKFSKVLRVLALVFLFIKKISVRTIKRKFPFLDTSEHVTSNDQYVVFKIEGATSNAIIDVAVIKVPKTSLDDAKNYYFRKATKELEKFVSSGKYEKISALKDDILYYTSRILLTQKITGKFSITDAALDLSEATFCVPLTDSHSPIAYAIVLDTHWFDPDVKHAGVESTLRYAQNTAYIVGGRDLVKQIVKGCIRCRILHKQGVKVAMGPIPDDNLRIAPVFYLCQTDLCGPYNAYSPANKRATLKVYFVVFCCMVTGAVDCRVMEDYTTDSFVFGFERFACRFGYPKRMYIDEGSQLVKGCQDMVLSFADSTQRLSVEHGVEFETCPVGAHYMHGKVERKIQQIKSSFEKTLDKRRLSILQWETLGQQVSNSINNLPIGLGNKVASLESLDILTPNRLILGRNNCRGPVTPLQLSGDLRRIVESNRDTFECWFREWLVSYVPSMILQPKWFETERSVRVGDVVLFRKSDKEFDNTYQYGIVESIVESSDGLVRVVEVQYQNFSENTKRTTKRGVRELVVIHPVDELSIQEELDDFARNVLDQLV